MDNVIQCFCHIIEVQATGAKVFTVGSCLQLLAHLLPIEPRQPASEMALALGQAMP